MALTTIGNTAFGNTLFITANTTISGPVTLSGATTSVTSGNLQFNDLGSQQIDWGGSNAYITGQHTNAFLKLSAVGSIQFLNGGTEQGRWQSGGLVVGTLGGAGDGTLHVHTATAGTVTAHASYDEGIFENSGDAGITILGSASGQSGIAMGDSGNNLAATLVYRHDAQEWRQTVEGTQVLSHSGSGMVVGSPTGGAKGAGTINAVGVYDDNTLLTCYVFDAALDGVIDDTKWDAKVPNKIVPTVPETETQLTKPKQVEREEVEFIGGKAVIKKITETVDVPQFEEVPAVDENGKPIMDMVSPSVDEVLDDDGNVVTKAVPAVYAQRTVERPIMVKVPGKPEQEIARTHEDMRKFKARLGSDTDPLDIDKYTNHWKTKRHLSSLPNEANFDPESGLSAGEWVQRLVETVEIQAVHIAALNDRLKVLER